MKGRERRGAGLQAVKKIRKTPAQDEIGRMKL
jgi:hypothetical protein